MANSFEVDLSTNRIQLVFLSGIGQSAAAWDPVIAGLGPSMSAVSYAITDIVPNHKPFTMAAAISGLDTKVDALGADQVIIVGLSLGAAVALSYAIAYPDRVAGLVLSGGQVRPSPGIMLLESALVRLLPERTMGLPPELSKDRLREILSVVSKIDFRSSLGKIAAPALVICGTNDKPNLSAAKVMAARLPHAELALVADGGHELNTDMPVEFGNLLASFLNKLQG